MKKWILWSSVAVIGCMAACKDENEKLNAIITVESQFQTTVEDWAGGFSGYSSVTNDTTLEKSFGRARLPAVLDSTKYGLRMQGYNRGDGMFMFLKKKVSGLAPGRDYKVTFDINLGTSYSASDPGTGGSPASSVYLKAGASPNEPTVKLLNKVYTISIDNGTQSEGGKEMNVLGNVANGLDKNIYKLVSRSNSDNPVSVRANSNGEIWLCVGSDSGFKDLTVLYYDKIKATIKE
ncbi:hypothetical protein [Dyadobacter sp. NIV53]|uniref:hypothetical protein n=1 Tax=Dyadobacter sp. NIV53 TaxID=2861765 RepID=UPI001C877633|nr:hypothetical protein [Dyadobacter sp. NIV53]